jgi:hypothetical protein
MSRHRQPARRSPTVDTLRRRSIRDSARAPAARAVWDQVVAPRHRERGLVVVETGYAELVIAWLAGGWLSTLGPAVEVEAA